MGFFVKFGSDEGDFKGCEEVVGFEFFEEVRVNFFEFGVLVIGG